MAHPENSCKEIRRSSRRSKRSSKKGDGVESSRRRSRKQNVDEKQRRRRSRRQREDSPNRRHNDELSPESLARKEIQRQQNRAMMKRVARRGSTESDDLFTMFCFSRQIENDETHLEIEREKFAKMQRRESMKKRQPISAESLFPETEKDEHVHQKGRVKRRESFLRRLSTSMRISPAVEETPTNTKPVKRGSLFGNLLRRASSLASSNSEDY